MIEFRASDLAIAQVDDKESGLKKEVLRIRSFLAFDEDFIEECKLKGVKKWEDRPISEITA